MPGMITKSNAPLTRLYLMPNRKKLLIVSGLFFLICAVGILIFQSESSSAQRSIQFQVQSLEQQLKQESKTYAELVYFSNNLDSAKQQYGALIKAFPPATRVDALLSEITRLGTSSGLKFVSFKPGTALDNQYYFELPVSVSVVGGFHQIGAFLSGIANLPESVVAVNEFSISRVSPGSEMLQLDFTATLYYSSSRSLEVVK